MPHNEEYLKAKELKERRERHGAYRTSCLQCEECPALVISRKKAPWGKPTYGYGNIDSQVMFVGEAPGRDGCATTGIPFTRDRSGELYNWVLKYLGYTLEDVYTTNIVKCWPADSNENNRTPTDDECHNCFNHLLNEIRIVRPAIIVALGRTPERILRRYQRNNPNMAVLQVPIEYIPHPAFILRNGGYPGTDTARVYTRKFAKFLGDKGSSKQEDLRNFFTG